MYNLWGLMSILGIRKILQNCYQILDSQKKDG